VSANNQREAINDVNYIIGQAKGHDPKKLFEKYPYRSNDVHLGMYLLRYFGDDGKLAGLSLFSVVQGELLYLQNTYILKQYRSGASEQAGYIFRKEFLPLGFSRIITFISNSNRLLQEQVIKTGWIQVGENLGKNKSYCSFELELVEETDSTVVGSGKPMIWIRSESRPDERRTVLVPAHAKALVDAGYKVYVEKSQQRIFTDGEYETVGCRLKEPGSWKIAPANSLIIGLKELPTENFPLIHRHFQAGHCLDGETGSTQLLQRYKTGGGTLYALEKLLDSRKKQIVLRSDGYFAGVCGAAVALMVWQQKRSGANPPYRILQYFKTKSQLKEYLRSTINPGHLQTEENCLIIAPDGNVGHGVRAILKALGIKYDTWTRKETINPETFKTIIDYEIVFNGISIESLDGSEPCPIFLSHETLESAHGCKLSLIADIACYAKNPRNPFPVYSQVTTFANPTLRTGNVDIMAIDNLPTMLPEICSEEISEDFFPLLCQYLMIGDRVADTPWPYAVERFKNALKEYCI
jgi:saccharopine dehydrogenase (NAD+, L-lysine-forming)